jgi:hypothetical protein
MRKVLAALAVAFTASGCALLRHHDVDADDVEVYQYGVPTSPFKKVADLAFWVPKQGLGEPTIDDILPELRERAKHAGADAVVDVHWTLRGARDFGVYQVTATGIAYAHDDPAAAPSGTGSSRESATGAVPPAASTE